MCVFILKDCFWLANAIHCLKLFVNTYLEFKIKYIHTLRVSFLIRLSCFVVKVSPSLWSNTSASQQLLEGAEF